MTSLFGGVVYGMAILALMTYVVLLWANPVLHQRVWMMPTSWFFTHARFGLGVARAGMAALMASRRIAPRWCPTHTAGRARPLSSTTGHSRGRLLHPNLVGIRQSSQSPPSPRDLEGGGRAGESLGAVRAGRIELQ
jgi:hypothetical protein